MCATIEHHSNIVDAIGQNMLALRQTLLKLKYNKFIDCDDFFLALEHQQPY